ncbi:inositol monophosphatase family protein [Alkalinema pantanalense CENA528]|uniref:inositol monophosphatase family protein n=1 Tax=Alkalinema pantanalense TaxID=1620705 RepID=UPI003D6FD144
MSLIQEQQVAIAAVRSAAQICERIRTHNAIQVVGKADASPVTVADFAAQAILCQGIATAFPQDAIVAEESASLLRQADYTRLLQQVTDWVRSEVPPATPEQVCNWIDLGQGQVSDRFWTIDPIDGTKGFIRGAQYAIAVALIEAGTVQLGVLGCPALKLPGFPAGIIMSAIRNHGIVITSLETGATQPWKSFAPTILRLAESVEAGHGNPELQRQVAHQAGCTEQPLPMDSQAKYAAIVGGQAALYMRLPWVTRPDYRENIWDHAAGSLLIEAAGGTVTDMHGQPLEFALSHQLVNNAGIIASLGLDHDRVIASLPQETSPTTDGCPLIP